MSARFLNIFKCNAKFFRSKLRFSIIVNSYSTLTQAQRSPRQLHDFLRLFSSAQPVIRNVNTIRKECDPEEINSEIKRRLYYLCILRSSCLEILGVGKSNHVRLDSVRTFTSSSCTSSQRTIFQSRKICTSSSSLRGGSAFLHSDANIISDENKIAKIDRDDDSESLELSHSDVDVKSISELAGTTYNLAPFVEKSITLQNLVRIGVDLSKVEKVNGMAEHLVMSDFNRDVLPYLQHLANIGVEPDKLGYIISCNPRLLKLSLGELEAQVGYLVSKKFTLTDVASMVSRAPIMLLMDPQMIDKKLGFLQNTFNLSGYDIRCVALTFPKLLPWRKRNIDSIRFTLKEFLNFSDHELKKMIIKEPKLFTANKYHMMKAHDYIHNTMLISHNQIVEWPKILHTRTHIIKSRHLFLLHKGRAQYDPFNENYVALKTMIACNAEKFCQEVAKTQIVEYYDFLKTI